MNLTIANKAQDHIKDVATNYQTQVANSIQGSTVYRKTPSLRTEEGCIPKMTVAPETTTDRIISFGGLGAIKVAALNFASYKIPGGGFLAGSMAQEEALCHDTTLYNVISAPEFEDEYKWNCKNLNQGLYTNFAIYSPNIYLTGTSYPCKCDIITSAAPNLNAYRYRFDQDTYEKTLVDRLEFVLGVADSEKVDILILGAFGCGVFRNNPTIVAQIFKDLLWTKKYHFAEVYFSIPPGYNYQSFEKIFR